jgi:hypothetical protein
MSMEEVTKNEFMQVIEETRLRLKKNSEWRERYSGYAKEIMNNHSTIKSVRSSFHEWSPLKLYLNTTSAKAAKHSVNFELRYLGQTVAKLTGNMDKGLKLSTTKKLEKTNLRDFDCNICLSSAEWDGKNAKQFRNYFKNRTGARKANPKRNEEHRLESQLLTEFSKTKSKEKPLLRIQPVTIAGVRFPMPTPISASNHKAIKYSGTYGGGIDVLARTGKGGKATHLCIMELKDKNEKREPPKAAMKQAIAYVTFIRELLRSDAGPDWWNLFGFKGNVPEPLELYATCVMPSNDNNDYSFGNMELNIKRDIIKLHYIYFTEENGNKIRIKPGYSTIGVVE